LAYSPGVPFRLLALPEDEDRAFDNQQGQLSPSSPMAPPPPHFSAWESGRDGSPTGDGRQGDFSLQKRFAISIHRS